MFEQNGYTEDPNLREYRKQFTAVGLAMLASSGLAYVASLFVSFYVLPSFPDLADSGKIWYWLYTICVQYVICMPLGMFMLRSFTKKSKPEVGEKKDTTGFLIVLAIAFAFMYAGNVIGNFLNSLTESISGVSSDAVDITLKNTLSVVMYFAVVVVIAPVMEELLFRKCLLDAIRPYGEKTAVILGALIFGLAHQNMGQFAYAFLAGLAMGYIYIHTGRLGYSVFIHMFTNFICGFVPELAQSVLMDVSAYNEFAESYTEFMNSVSDFGSTAVLEMLEMFRTLYDMLPGIMTSSIAANISSGLALAGWILFIAYKNKIKFRETEIKIRREDIGYAVFLAPGMVIYFVYSLTALVLSYFAY